jgi:uncharacterized protein DUF5916/cellulose/xylan binding protein with CBM9 domain
VRGIPVGLAALASVTWVLAGPQEGPASPPPQAANAPFSIRALRTDSPPAIDGVLDDAAWEVAPSFEDFTVVTPVEGAAPSERTIVRVLFDDDRLYIAVRCFDSEAGRILAREQRRDATMEGDDLVEIVLDPFADRRNGYLFQLSAGGAKTDGLIDTSKGDVRYEWDGLWEGKARRDAEGWAAEVAVPFKTISFNTQAGAWGLNVQRTIRRKQEVVRWASPRTNSQVTRLSDAGRLSGIEGIRQGLGLTIKPYLTTREDTVSSDTDVKPGLDVFYKLTPSTTLAVTVNTDFAETEVDQRIVNLTRFPIFFPEKRAFFLQDTTLFSYGGIFQSPLPFYSRRIGIVGGEEKDILAGVRVTGREGRVNFGLMDVQMRDDPDLREKNLSVGRVSFNVLDESTAGLIFTNGDPGTTGDNTLVGADFNYRNRNALGGQVFEAHGWAMASFSSEGPAVARASSGTGADDTAFGGRISFPNDRWSGSIFAGRYGDDFRPTLGFIERPGTYELHTDLRRRWRPQSFIRRIDLRTDQSYFLDLDGDVQTEEGALGSVELEDRYGDVYHTELQSNRDHLTQPFEISDGVTIPEGHYGFYRFQASVAGAAARVLAPSLTLRTGNFYEGSRTDYVGGLSFRPSGGFFGSAQYEYDNVALPQGSFIVRVVSVRTDLLISPELAWTTIVQYDNASRNLGLFSRVRWEFRLGQEIFFVASQNYERLDDRSFENTSGDVTLKVGLTLRF